MPAPKRRAISDINPQWLSFSFIPGTPGTTQTWALALPQNRLLQPRPNEAVVLELLRVQWGIPGIPDVDDVTETAYFMQGAITTRDHGTTAVTFGMTDLIDIVAVEFQGAWTAGGSYALVHHRVDDHDLTDSSGNGPLVATDNLFIQLYGAAEFALVINGRLLYRFRTVPLSEFIGMVQSQQ